MGARLLPLPKGIESTDTIKDDLNPLRAGIVDTPEAFEYTSIQPRLEALNHQKPTATCLHPFIGHPSNEAIDSIPFCLMEHIELVDWTARQYRDNKASMGIHMPPILHV